MLRALRSSLILFALCVPPLLRAEEGGTLQRVREEVSADRDEERPPKRRCDTTCEDDGDDCCILGRLLGYLLTAPFTVPHLALADDFHVRGHFLAHPYAGDQPGFMSVNHFAFRPDDAPHPEAELPRLRNWAGRVAVEESNDFGGLNRFTGHLLLETSSRFGLQTSWSHLHERLGGGRSDDLALGDVNLTFRFAQHELAQFRAGLGFRVLADRAESHFGFNFTYGFDLYPARPFVVSAVLDAGTLGAAGVFHLRGTAGLLLSRWEVYGGYDYLRIGSQDLQGPVIGLRLWF